MPEGLEIRRAADRLNKILAGQTTHEVVFSLPALADWGPELSGRVVTAVETRGKAMLTRFEHGWSIYSHNQLFGRWDVKGPRGKAPVTNRQERLRIVTPKGTARLYSASDIAVLAPGEADTHPFLARLGPDVFSAALTPALIAARLDEKPFRRRRLEALLLDQGFLAGLGNYLRSEVLFLAGLAPERRPMDLSPTECEWLGAAILWTVQQSYATGGLTVPQARATELKARKVPRWRYRHFVFNQPGQTCALCEQVIVRKRVGGRRLDTCPGCQPAGGGTGEPPVVRLGIIAWP